MRHLAGTVILLFVSAAVVYASTTVPGLIPFFSIGAWLYITGWLCDRFFTANDESVAADAEPAAAGAGTGACYAGLQRLDRLTCRDSAARLPARPTFGGPPGAPVPDQPHPAPSSCPHVHK